MLIVEFSLKPGNYIFLLNHYFQFHQNLPESYEVFKSDLHKMFPIIYDTKFIATELRHHYREKDEKGRFSQDYIY